MKAWYEDKQSFYRALAALAARLALWLLSEAALLYEKIGLTQESAALRKLVASAPAVARPTEPTSAELHRELFSDEAPTVVDGWLGRQESGD